MHIIESFPVGAFQCNCIILGDAETKEAIIVDPGDDIAKIMKVVDKHGFQVKSIIHSHSHIDHIGATTELQQRTNGRVLLHKEDLFLYEKYNEQAQFLRLAPKASKPVPPDAFLNDGDELVAGNVKGVVLHSPGHTPGSCGFYFPELKVTGLLIPGDTLFAGSVGRTDLWGGDYDLEIQSIKKKYMTLPDETVIIPGHGPETTIGFERQHNPFLS